MGGKQSNQRQKGGENPRQGEVTPRFSCAEARQHEERKFVKRFTVKTLPFVSECLTYEGESLPSRLPNDCDKSGDHKDFIPVKSFQKTHLPPGYQTDYYYQSVQTMCDLTVRVVVCYTSHARPDTFPGPTKPYPYSSCKGKTVKRFGTGFVTGPIQYQSVDGPCPCKRCQDSNQPLETFCLISVRTATHVVFDDFEAPHAKFELFYDSKDRKGVKMFYGVKVISDPDWVESDMCTVVCVTHDKEVVQGLIRARRTFATILETDTPPVLVSHPHGGSKHVTVIHDRLMDQAIALPLNPLQEGRRCKIPTLPDSHGESKKFWLEFSDGTEFAYEFKPSDNSITFPPGTVVRDDTTTKWCRSPRMELRPLPAHVGQAGHKKGTRHCLVITDHDPQGEDSEFFHEVHFDPSILKDLHVKEGKDIELRGPGSHTLPTCPGSSGAWIPMPLTGNFLQFMTHSGATEEKPINRSGYCIIGNFKSNLKQSTTRFNILSSSPVTEEVIAPQGDNSTFDRVLEHLKHLAHALHRKEEMGKVFTALGLPPPEDTDSFHSAMIKIHNAPLPAHVREGMNQLLAASSASPLSESDTFQTSILRMLYSSTITPETKEWLNSSFEASGLPPIGDTDTLQTAVTKMLSASLTTDLRNELNLEFAAHGVVPLDETDTVQTATVKIISSPLPATMKEEMSSKLPSLLPGLSRLMLSLSPDNASEASNSTNTASGPPPLNVILKSMMKVLFSPDSPATNGATNSSPAATGLPSIDGMDEDLLRESINSLFLSPSSPDSNETTNQTPTAHGLPPLEETDPMRTEITRIYNSPLPAHIQEAMNPLLAAAGMSPLGESDTLQSTIHQMLASPLHPEEIEFLNSPNAPPGLPHVGDTDTLQTLATSMLSASLTPDLRNEINPVFTAHGLAPLDETDTLQTATAKIQSSPLPTDVKGEISSKLPTVFPAVNKILLSLSSDNANGPTSSTHTASGIPPFGDLLTLITQSFLSPSSANMNDATNSPPTTSDLPPLGELLTSMTQSLLSPSSPDTNEMTTSAHTISSLPPLDETRSHIPGVNHVPPSLSSPDTTETRNRAPTASGLPPLNELFSSMTNFLLTSLSPPMNEATTPVPAASGLHPLDETDANANSDSDAKQRTTQPISPPLD